MYISSKNTGQIRPDAISQTGTLTEIEPVQPTGVGLPSSGAGSDRSDKVEISDAGRALAARDGVADSSTVDPTRTSEIRGRILSGAYNTLDVVDSVARRILDSGDL